MALFFLVEHHETHRVMTLYSFQDRLRQGSSLEWPGMGKWHLAPWSLGNPQPIHKTSQLNCLTPPWISASPSAPAQSCAWRQGSRWAPAQRTRRVVICWLPIIKTQTPARHKRPDSRQGAGEPSPSPPSSSPATSKRKRLWALNFGKFTFLACGSISVSASSGSVMVNRSKFLPCWT